MRIKRRQPAAVRPAPVCGHRVDPADIEDRVDDVGTEPRSLCNTARHDVGRCGTEDPVPHKQLAIVVVLRCGGCTQCKVRIADEGCVRPKQMLSNQL